MDQFQICAEIATLKETHSFTKSHWPPVLRKTFQRLQTKHPQWLGQVISSQGSNYCQEANRFTERAYLDGYWQSERNFFSIAPVIRQEFQLTQPFSADNKLWIESASQPCAVSVHIRRGRLCL